MPTPNAKPLPTIGVALPIAELQTHHDWILEGRRDVELQDFFTAETLEGDWTPLAERARALLEDHEGRIGIHGPFPGLNIASPDPAIRDIVTRRMNQGLDVCAAVRATQMVIHSPYSTWMYNNLDKDQGARARVLDYTHLTLGDVVKRAEDMGVVLVIENIEDKDPNDRLVLAQSFASPALKLSIDTGHAHYAHGYTSAPPVDYYVRSAGAMLAHVHIQDADGYADRHWAPGEGTIHWHAVFKALADIDANPHIVLELADKSKIRQGADFLIRNGFAK